MIFLWNQERVVYEIMELARFKIAKNLEIETEFVFAKLSYEGGKFKPSFSVESKEVPIRLLGDIDAIMADIWASVRSELINRLASIGKRRDDYGYKKEGETQTTSKAATC